MSTPIQFILEISRKGINLRGRGINSYGTWLQLEHTVNSTSAADVEINKSLATSFPSQCSLVP